MPRVSLFTLSSVLCLSHYGARGRDSLLPVHDNAGPPAFTALARLARHFDARAVRRPSCPAAARLFCVSSTCMLGASLVVKVPAVEGSSGLWELPNPVRRRLHWSHEATQGQQAPHF
ncbi:hypothetical protein B0H65DRAFT_460065, partial [Neurospora tetraspora]